MEDQELKKLVGSVVIIVVCENRARFDLEAGPQFLTVLVEDRGRSNPRLKFPGGHIETSDGTAEVAARRELEEETGLVPSRIEQIGTPMRKVDQEGRIHYLHFFAAEVNELGGLKERGNDGEFVHVCDIENVWECELLPTHAIFIREFYVRETISQKGERHEPLGELQHL